MTIDLDYVCFWKEFIFCQQPVKAFVKEPWKRYNDAESGILSHSSLEYHKLAMTRAPYFLKQFSYPGKADIQPWVRACSRRILRSFYKFSPHLLSQPAPQNGRSLRCAVRKHIYVNNAPGSTEWLATHERIQIYGHWHWNTCRHVCSNETSPHVSGRLVSRVCFTNGSIETISYWNKASNL